MKGDVKKMGKNTQNMASYSLGVDLMDICRQRIVSGMIIRIKTFMGIACSWKSLFLSYRMGQDLYVPPGIMSETLKQVIIFFLITDLFSLP